MELGFQREQLKGVNVSIVNKPNRSGVMCYWDDVANKSKHKSPVEDIEAETFIGLLKVHRPDIREVIFHVANESSSQPNYRAKLGRMGLKKGVADYIIVGSPAICIELKRQRKADSSIGAEQSVFIKKACEMGAIALIAYGANAAFHAVTEIYDTYYN